MGNTCDNSQLQLVDGATEPSWEEAPLMDAPPLGVESNHCYDSTIRRLERDGLFEVRKRLSGENTCAARSHSLIRCTVVLNHQNLAQQ
jgi:hypothetical protein